MRLHASVMDDAAVEMPTWSFVRTRLRDPHWDPVFRAAEDAGLSINFHIGFAVSAPRGTRPDVERGDE